jgi:hypothetical protein
VTSASKIGIGVTGDIAETSDGFNTSSREPVRTGDQQQIA